MKQRVITAIIMIAVGLPILIYGKLPFIILGVLLALVATQEMIDMKETVAKTPIEVKLFTMLATLMIMFSSFNFKTLSFTGTLTFGLGTMALFLFILLLAVVVRKDFSIKDAGYYLLTIFYVGSTFHSMIFIRFLGLKCTSESIVPHSGVGGCAPIPRKPRAAISRMALEKPSEA